LKCFTFSRGLFPLFMLRFCPALCSRDMNLHLALKQSLKRIIEYRDSNFSISSYSCGKPFRIVLSVCHVHNASASACILSNAVCLYVLANVVPQTAKHLPSHYLWSLIRREDRRFASSEVKPGWSI
jgi:hypothetical protein